MSKPKTQKTHKIDCRMTESLWTAVDGFAVASHLSRSQVVERALLQYFGQSVAESPAELKTAIVREEPEPPTNGPRIGFHAKKGNPGPSAALNQTRRKATS
jgi:hypothetical protein